MRGMRVGLGLVIVLAVFVTGIVATSWVRDQPVHARPADVTSLAASAASPSGRMGEVGESSRAADHGRGGAAVQRAVLDEIEAAGSADVLVLLADGAAPDAPVDRLGVAASSVQDTVVADMPARGFALRTRYDYLPTLAATVDARGLAALRNHPLVVAVEEDGWMAPVAVDTRGAQPRRAQRLEEAVPSVGADYVNEEYGITGEGVTVAVLDTGIDNEHPDFADKVLDQYCYSSSRSCAPNDIVESPNAQDEAGHGTAVSGIILSHGTESRAGVAPDADLVAVRVFKDRGGASNSDIIKGLDWVLRRQLPLNIGVVNMSLGGGSAIGNNCDDQNRNMKAAFQRLVARKVAIFVATGNNGEPSLVSSPACISNSIAVGATYDTEAANGGGWCPQQKDVTPLTIACFTNRGRAMDLLAPGIFIRSSKLGGGVTNNGAGTSYAAPMAAGVAALLLQVDPDLRPTDLQRILEDTGRDVKHLENDDIFPLVDARAAVESILPDLPTATPTEVAPTTTPTRFATDVPDETATPTREAVETETVSTPDVATATATPRASETAPEHPVFLPSLSNRLP